MRKNLSNIVVNVFLYVQLLIFQNSSLAASSREFQLKAAYLLNFARFVYWPDDVFKSDESKFNICVYGKNPFGESLERLSTKKIQDRYIIHTYANNSKELKVCQIVYISASEKKSYEALISELPENVLTVSDIEGFSQSGGMIEFVKINNRIKFEISVSQSNKSNVRYRSQLLEVAEKIR